MAVELTLGPLMGAPGALHNTLVIRLGGGRLGARLAASRRLGGACVWRIAVPANAVRRGALAIELELTEADTGADQFCLIRLRVLHVVAPVVPDVAQPMAETRFSWNEATEGLLGEGFGTPEDAYAWAVGAHSVLHVARSVTRGKTKAGHSVLLDMRPFAPPDGSAMRQRVAIGADERLLGFVDLRAQLTLGFALPAVDTADDFVLISFNNVDAAFETSDPLFHFGKPFACALSTVRVGAAIPAAEPAYRAPLVGNLADGSLQDAVRSLTGLGPEPFARRFESMGNGCALPNVQRRLGDSRAGLLRFVENRQPALVRAILAGFAEIGDVDSYHWGVRHADDAEWRLIEESYGFSIGTPYPRDVAPPADGFVRLARVMTRLAENFLAQIGDGEAVFVWRGSEAMSGLAAEAAAYAVWAALRVWGAGVRMIWLSTGGEGVAGSAQRLGCGLVRGHLEAVGVVSDEAVVSALANGLVLVG